MRLSVLPTSPIPVYRQLYEEIFSQVISGELKSGDPLPPIRTVAKELGIGVITVRTAWDALEADGLIVTRAGSGCSIAPVDRERLNELRGEAVSEPLKSLIVSARKLGFTEEELIRCVRDEMTRK